MIRQHLGAVRANGSVNTVLAFWAPVVYLQLLYKKASCLLQAPTSKSLSRLGLSEER